MSERLPTYFLFDGRQVSQGCDRCFYSRPGLAQHEAFAVLLFDYRKHLVHVLAVFDFRVLSNYDAVVLVGAIFAEHVLEQLEAFFERLLTMRRNVENLEWSQTSSEEQDGSQAYVILDSFPER